MSPPQDPLSASRAQLHLALATLRTKLDTLDRLCQADPISEAAELEVNLITLDTVFVKNTLLTHRQHETRLHRQLQLTLIRTGGD